MKTQAQIHGMIRKTEEKEATEMNTQKIALCKMAILTLKWVLED